MHEAADAVAELARKQPDTVGAMLAIDAASGILASAKERLAHDDFEEAFLEAKHAMRMASSALLIKDGFLATSLDATVHYISDKYPDMVPVEQWREMESRITGEGPGLLNLVIRLSGKTRKAGEADARSAVLLAGRFIACVNRIMEMR